MTKPDYLLDLSRRISNAKHADQVNHIYTEALTYHTRELLDLSDLDVLRRLGSQRIESLCESASAVERSNPSPSGATRATGRCEI